MLTCEVQGESCVGERTTFGLVGWATARRRRAGGFSLIELLVVVAIVAILASLLFPMLKMAKESANAAVCMNSLRQVCASTLMYAQDYNGYTAEAYTIPDDRTWAYKMKQAGYIPGSGKDFTGWGCPSRPTNPGWTWYDAMWRVYGRYRDTTPAEPSAWPQGNMGTIMIYRFSTPSRAIIYGDAMNTGLIIDQNYCAFEDRVLAGTSDYVYLGHNASANIGFVDGHVAGCGKSALRSLDVQGGYDKRSRSLVNF